MSTDKHAAIGATHLYYCTVAGAPGTWIGLA
jgi:hypothetical protein